MIARLSGILAETSSDSAIVDVGGVGYIVQASARTLDALGPVGGEVLILTELQVREDAWTLFGFGSAAERDSFRALTSVQGVAGLTGAAPAPRAGAAADALSALANLGFKPAEASAAVNAAQDELGPEANLDALVRLALRKAAK